MDLTEAEDLKKRWQEYTEELYKKDLHDPDNYGGVITHLEPDSMECDVKWALGAITMNKASGGDGILVELFQILKDDAVKVLHSICQEIWKTQQWPQDWKRSIFIQSQRKAIGIFIPIPKNDQPHNCTHLMHYQINAQNYPRQASTVCELCISRCKAEEPEIKLPTSIGSSKKKQENSRKHLLLLY